MDFKLHYQNDPERLAFDPVPEIGGRRFIVRVYSGDWLRPFGPGNWLKEPFFRSYVRGHTTRAILPFIAWRWPFSDKGGYVGFKPFGADYRQYPMYDAWMPVHDTGVGSKALCPSIRLFADLNAG